MANVLLLTLVFPPDAVSTAQIMGELAVDLQARGHSVTVVTTSPHYNRDLDAEARQPLQLHWGRLLRKSDFHGIAVFHTLMPRKGGRVLGRLAAWTGFHVLSTIASLFVVPRPQVLIVPSPPLTIGLSAWLVCLIRRARYVYNVQEIYPDIAVNLGALRNRTAIRLLEALERFVYRRAAAVTVIAPRMRDRLIAKRVPAEKVEVVPNFVDIADLSPRLKDNPFSREWGIVDAFAATYAGNLGPAQGLETFVDAAALLRDEPAVRCLLIGGGISEVPLRALAERLGVRDAFVPHQPYTSMPDVYAASDVCLVAQAAETGCDAIPSKVYRIMACGRPIIACTDPASDLAHLVEQSGAGAVVLPGSPRALADAIRLAAQHRSEWRAKGVAGRAYVEQHYSRERISVRYHDLVERLTQGPLSSRAARAIQ